MSKLNNVNSTDILDAIRLGCRTMCSVFNSDDNDMPYWASTVYPESGFAFFWANSDGHVPGRHLNALLNAEDAAGIAIDETCIAKHANAAYFAYGGPIPVPLTRNEIGGPVVNFCPHHIREGFHALYALAHFRGSQHARELAEVSIDTIFQYWHPDRGWNWDVLEGELALENALKKLNIDMSKPTFITGLARSIGPLVKFHRTVGSPKAMELAIVLKEKAINEFFLEQGAYDRDTFEVHTHSTTCVMSSLAQLADLTCDSQLMNRVRAFYDNGLNDIRDPLGWVIESSRDGANPDFGEANNTGDIVETALILGRWGYPEYYEDAERILRSHLLPSQLRDTSFINEPPNPDNVDCRRDIAERNRGAFGFPAPYGHHPVGCEHIAFHMDIVGGVVGSLCEAYRQIVRSDHAGHWVNLLFDHKTDAVTIESPYTHDRLRIRVTKPGPLFVRIPSWVDRNRLTLPTIDETPRYSNGYLFLSKPPMGSWLTIDFDLPERQIRMKHRTHNIRVRLRGDSVTAMDNFDTDLTFFDPIE